MNLIRPAAALAALLIAGAMAHAQTAPVSFEVASVKPSAPDEANNNSVSVGLHIDGAQVHVEDFSLKDYIRIAYQVKFYQVIAPDWTAEERYDVDAKLPDGATAAEVPQMLQDLLKQRFGLVSHVARKEMSVYALEQAPGGAHLKTSAVTAAPAAASGAVSVAATGSGRGVAINLPGGAFFGLTPEHGLEATHITMPVFADALGRFVSKPVIDETHLDGVYDMTLKLQPEDYQALLIQSAITAGVNLPPQVVAMAEGASETSLFLALESQGLKMHSTNAPVEVRVVDKMDRSPSGND